MKKILSFCFCLVAILGAGSCSSDNEVPEGARLTISSEDGRFTVDTSGTSGQINFGAAGGDLVVDVNSNIAWVPALTENSAWCSTKRDGDAVVISALGFREAGEERSASINLEYQGQAYAIITVRQSGDDSEPIVLSKETAFIHGTGGYVEIEVTSVAEDWGYEPVEGADWLQSSREGNTLRFEAGTNSGDERRNATFRVFAGPAGARETHDFKIVQPTDKAMILEYTLTSDILEAYIPFIGDLSLVVDWGDGTVETYVGEYNAYDEDPDSEIEPDHDFIFHTYSQPGIYEVSITGEAEAMYCGHLQRVNLGTITDLKRWGNLSLKMMYNALTWTNIKKLPASTDGGFKDVGTFSYAFHSNQSLEVIEEGLFNDVHKSQGFEYIFAWNYKLKEVGPNMFKGLQSTGSFECGFFYCSELEKVGEGFAVDSKISTFKHAFFLCQKLKDIPEGMFSGSASKSFESTFQTCHALEAIPDRLFENCSEATEFMYAFYNCLAVKKVGKNVFSGCTSADRLNSLFASCKSLEEVDEDIFAGINPSPTYAVYVFNDSGLKTVPENLFVHLNGSKNYSSFFSATNLTQIPEKLLYPIKQATDVSDMFASSQLTTIPANLFHEQVDLQSIVGCFANTQITEIPANLFSIGWKIVYAYGAFENTRIKRIPATLFADCIYLEDIRSIFDGCTELEEVPVGIFDDCARLTRLDNAFYNCSAWTGPSPFTNYQGVDVPLYYRYRYPAKFTAPVDTKGVFYGCTGLDDYALLESDFPEWIEKKSNVWNDEEA